MSHDDVAPRHFQRLDRSPNEATPPSDPELRDFLKSFVADCPSVPGWGAARIQAQLKATTGRDVDVEFIQWAMNELGR